MRGTGAKPKKPRKARAAKKPPPQKKARDKPLRLKEPLDFDKAIRGLLAISASRSPKPEDESK